MKLRSSAMLSLHALLLLAGLGCVQLGGGYTPTSVTVPGEDGLFVKAEAVEGDRRARIEFERVTR